MAPVIVVYGPPGSGKTCQAQRLAEESDLEWLSSGELLRTIKDPLVLERINRGELAHSEDVNKVMEQVIGKLPRSKGLVLDGFPRMMAEIDWMVKYLPSVGRKITAVILLEVSEEESRRRIHLRAEKSGRADDAAAVFDLRRRRYQDRILGIIKYFREHGLLRVIDGEADKDTVAARIRATL